MGKSKYPEIIKINMDGKKVDATRCEGSVIDPVGFVATVENRVFRLITPSWAEDVKNLLSLPNIKAIFETGLIETYITPYTAKGYPLIVEHEKFPFKSLYHEWAPNMVKDAAQTICRLGKILYEAGYSYKDGNLPNLTFIHSTPKFFDLGSIIPIKKLPNSGAHKFPLEFSGAFIQQTGTTLEKHTHNITKDGILKIRNDFKDNAVGFFDAIDKYLEGANFIIPLTEWAGYGRKRFNFNRLNPKQKAVYTILKRLKEEGMKTIVDIGGSKGAFSEPAADLGYHCATFDLDTTSVMNLYERVKESQRTITPLLMNFMEMTPRIRGHAPAHERLRSDISLYLAITHHLSLGRGISLDEQAKRLDKLTNHYSIVEFIPLTDKHVRARGGWKKPTEYSVGGFTKAMEKYGFELLEQIPGAPEPRVILLYGRK
jgi:hypothetical protein